MTVSVYTLYTTFLTIEQEIETVDLSEIPDIDIDIDSNKFSPIEEVLATLRRPLPSPSPLSLS